MVLLLRNHEIQGLMKLPEYIEAVELGYRDVGEARGVNFPRENLWIPGEKDESAKSGHLRDRQQRALSSSKPRCYLVSVLRVCKPIPLDYSKALRHTCFCLTRQMDR